MPFLAYPKIHRLGKEETDGLLEFGEVTVQEKIDGANTSIWLEDGVICGGSRTRKLGDESFNGFTKYIKEHEGIKKLFTDLPTYRLYGEWLVRHTISYKETAYKQFYLFDVYVESIGFLPQFIVEALAEMYGMKYPQVFCKGKMTLEKIMEFVGKTNLGEKGEGVVLKNDEFVNKFGDKVYAKVVTEKFKEDNALTFGGNNKHSDSYWEMFIINKYATLTRVQKIMNKLQPEYDRRMDKEQTARVIQTCYHDMITEEIWEIQKKVPLLNFKKLQGLSARKFAKIYHDILEGHISVAYGVQDDES
jgi:RNA ligase